MSDGFDGVGDSIDDLGMEDFSIPDDNQFEDVDISDVDGSKAGSGRLKVDLPGFYHFGKIKAIARPKPYNDDNMSKTRKPDILLECEVMCDVKGQSPVGSVFFQNIVLGGKGGGPVDKWDKERSTNFLVGVGILQSKGEDVIDPETGTTKVKASTLAARLEKLGHFCGKVELGKPSEKKDVGTGKVSYYPARLELPWGRGAYPVTSRDVAHVPKNLEAIKASGIVMPEVPGKTKL